MALPFPALQNPCSKRPAARPALDRMLQMALLDNPKGQPCMVGDAQRKWLADNLARVSKDTPVVVLSHSPLQKIYKGWNFWTEDAGQVQALLKPFDKVTVLYGHVHQIQYNQIDNMSFHAAMATAWLWPYPPTYTRVETSLPKLTVEMNRADPFQERDATGWQSINMDSGNIDVHYQLPDNDNRVVAFNEKTGRPEDTRLQDAANRTATHRHYWPGDQHEDSQANQTRRGCHTIQRRTGILTGTGRRVHRRRCRPPDGPVHDRGNQGEKLFHGGLKSKNTVSCDQCHPKATSIHPETCPKFQKQPGRVAGLREMVNWCIMNPLESDPLSADEPKMTVLSAYIKYERRGVPLAPGKH